MRRGEIYLVDLNSHVGSEQAGVRPALIVQNEKGNLYAPTTIVCPLTTKTKSELETHVELTPADCGIRTVSTVLCEQIRTIDKSRIQRKLGEITNRQKLEDINRKLMISIGLGA